MNVSGKFLALVLAVVALPASAEVYRQVDKNGNVTFSDKAGDGAQVIEVPPVTTVTLPKMQDVKTDARSPAKAASQSESSLYKSVTFNAPDDGAAFYSGNGDIELQVASTPALRNGHQFEVSIDGQPVGQNVSGIFVVRNVFRGTHNAQVSVVDSKGRPVKAGSSITFTVHRPTVLN